jgi:hypothetical protein
MRIIGSILAVAALLTGCASTRVTAFRDPDFADKHYTHVAVFALGAPLALAQDMEGKLCNSMAPTGCTPGLNILPPTRQYSADEVAALIARHGADAILVITMGADRSDSGVIGYQTFSSAQATGSATTTGTVSVYGNAGTYQGTTNGSASATGQSTTIPIMYFSRAAAGTVVMLDAASGKTAWRGEMQTTGHGMLNVTDDAFTSSESKEIAGQLRSAGLIARR